MTSIRLFFLILGFIVASATAQENNTITVNSDLKTQTTTEVTDKGNYTSVSPFIEDETNTTTQDISTTTTPINITSIPSNRNNTSSTVKPSTTTQKDNGKLLTTPKSLTTTKGSSTTRNNKSAGGRTAGSSTGIIIIIVIIILAALFGIACYLARRRGRRYSVDPTSRADEVNIPLSTVEPAESPAETVFQNGLQTFESTEPEPEAKSEEQKEQKAEADKSAVEPSAESAPPAPAPAPTPDSSGDKPKEAVAEQSNAAPVEQSVEEKTDDEGLTSNKTSVESLKETNENNSNNVDSTARGLNSSNKFWDVPLNCPK